MCAAQVHHEQPSRRILRAPRGRRRPGLRRPQLRPGLFAVRDDREQRRDCRAPLCRRRVVRRSAARRCGGRPFHAGAGDCQRADGRTPGRRHVPGHDAPRDRITMPRWRSRGVPSHFSCEPGAEFHATPVRAANGAVVFGLLLVGIARAEPRRASSRPSRSAREQHHDAKGDRREREHVRNGERPQHTRVHPEELEREAERADADEIPAEHRRGPSTP